MGEKNSLLSDRGRSKAQVYDIHACYSVLFTTHARDWYLFLDIHSTALVLTKRGDDLCWSFPDYTELTGYKMQGCQQCWVTVNIRAALPLSPNHYFIIWLMLPRCWQNAYTFPQRWKTNRSNLFLQIRYWSQIVCWGSDISSEKMNVKY